MRKTRIYQAVDIQIGGEFVLEENAYRHLIQVLRLPVGSQFQLFNGKGGEYTATVQSISRKEVVVKVNEYQTQERESSLALHLAQGIARPERMDYIVQKAVELGVTSFTPLLTERCNIKLTAERWEKRLWHWRQIIVAACEQCGRNTLPQLELPMQLQDWLLPPQSGLKLVLAPTAQRSIRELKGTVQMVKVLIGPEGGLSQNELWGAEQAGFLPLKLGPRVLRTETATVAALTALQCYFGDMG